jgi:hypothetical protein
LVHYAQLDPHAKYRRLREAALTRKLGTKQIAYDVLSYVRVAFLVLRVNKVGRPM